MGNASPIGVFDSGVGGLAVLQRIHARLPNVDTVYAADQAFTPHGARERRFIVDRARTLTETLANRGCQVIVVACNTATAAAIDTLRDTYPSLDFVGMEPAIKPAAAMTKTNVIGVLATKGTLTADRYQALAEAHGKGVSVIHRIGHGLAMDVEHGFEKLAATRNKLADHAAMFAAAGADVVVLGCTHYSFFADILEQAGSGAFAVIDPSAAVASQAARFVAEAELEPDAGSHIYLSTDPSHIQGRIQDLMRATFEVERI